MCRFLGFVSLHPFLLSDVLIKPENSLVKQSRYSQTKSVNADGFGFGWYDGQLKAPGVYKSTRPAWNDPNLEDLGFRLRSKCLIAHIRAMTIGEVTELNCHPFRYKTFIFAHNGTIKGISAIKKDLVHLLDEEIFLEIKGQTDSELFFAVILSFLKKQRNQETQGMHFIEAYLQAFRKALTVVKALMKQKEKTERISLNTLFSDGEVLIASRYCNETSPGSLDLFYTQEYTASLQQKSVLIASEPLDGVAEKWTLIPHNHFLCVEANLDVSLESV